MEQVYLKFIDEFFERLIEEYGFRIKEEFNEGQSFMIELNSGAFVIKIEKYFLEFYATLFNTKSLDNEINLFNLLEFLKKDDKNIPKSEYFRNEKDIEECYRKQLANISSAIYDNLSLINEYFNSEGYERRVMEFEKYWKNKHPELY